MRATDHVLPDLFGMIARVLGSRENLGFVVTGRTRDPTPAMPATRTGRNRPSILFSKLQCLLNILLWMSVSIPHSLTGCWRLSTDIRKLKLIAQKQFAAIDYGKIPRIS
jgi:hypothetical protein